MHKMFITIHAWVQSEITQTNSGQHLYVLVHFEVSVVIINIFQAM